MDELTSLLHRFSIEVVEASRQVSRDVIAFCMNSVIKPLLNSIGESDVRLKCCAPMPTECYLEGMKVTGKNEFELIVVLEQLTTIRIFNDVAGTNSSLSCYGQVIVQHANLSVEDLCVADGCGGSSHVLSATKVREHFAYIAAKVASVTVFQEATVHISYKEPYTLVKIFRCHDNYTFQLLPSLFFNNAWPPCAIGWGHVEGTSGWLTPETAIFCRQLGFFVVPISCPLVQEESLWRVSFTRAEKYLLIYDNLDSPQGVRKQVVRILKMLRTSDMDAFSPLSSYHLLTIVLHMCFLLPNASSWATHCLGERLLESLCHLIIALEKGELRHFFAPGCNLLAQYDRHVLLATALELKKIYDEFCVAPGKCIRLQC